MSFCRVIVTRDCGLPRPDHEARGSGRSVGRGVLPEAIRPGSFFWIYLLAGVLAFLAQISLAEAKELRASYELLRPWGTLLICLVFASLRGTLISIPLSLLFWRKVPGFSRYWKIPLCVFFIILALEPIFLGVAIMIILSFVSCP